MEILPTAPLIFLSYRRDDTKDITNRIATQLESEFGEEAVFIDRDILGGDEWEEVIRQQANDAKFLLVIIGSKWATIKNDAGQHRLSEDDDWVRREVIIGMDNKSVIPVLIDNTTLPAINTLPKILRPLHKFQAIPISTGEEFEGSMTTLVDTIKARMAQDERASQSVQHDSSPGSAVFGLGLVTIIGALFLVMNWRYTDRTEETLALIALLGGWVSAVVVFHSFLNNGTPDAIRTTVKNVLVSCWFVIGLSVIIVGMLVGTVTLEVDHRASATAPITSIDSDIAAISTQTLPTGNTSTIAPEDDETPPIAGVPAINQDDDNPDEDGLSVTRFTAGVVIVETSDTSEFSVGQRMVISTAETIPRPSHICRIATITENQQFTCRPELQHEDIPLAIEVGNPVSSDLTAVELLRFLPIAEDIIGFVINVPGEDSIIRLRQSVSITSGDVLVRVAFSISMGTALYLPDESTSLMIESVSEISGFPIATFAINTLGENVTLEDGMLVRFSACPSPGVFFDMIPIPAGEYRINENSTAFGEVATYMLEAPFRMSTYEVSGQQFATFLDELQSTISDRVACGDTTIQELETHFNESAITNLQLESNRRSTLPMGGLSAQQAQLFCQWYGFDLPTAQQWEIAASCPISGIDIGGDCTRYPWGEDRLWNGQPASEIFNIYHAECDNLSCLQPVLDGSVSQNGFMHMTGNASEWVLGNETYGGNACTKDMNALTTFTSTRQNTEICGSNNANPNELIGFRCVDTDTQN